jgi:two-component system OmpR family response regulator
MTKKILVLDDDDDLREVLCLAFESEGYETVNFSCPWEAVEFLEEQGPSDMPAMVMVDYMMPGLNGLDFIREAKARMRSSFDKAVFVLNTGRQFSSKELLKENILLLEKPVSLDDLFGLVHTYCEA